MNLRGKEGKEEENNFDKKPEFKQKWTGWPVKNNLRTLHY